MNGLPQPAYVMSEPHLSGYRVIIGYETLSDAQVAQAALSKPQACEDAQPVGLDEAQRKAAERAAMDAGVYSWRNCRLAMVEGGKIIGYPAFSRADMAELARLYTTQPAPEAEKLRVAVDPADMKVIGDWINDGENPSSVPAGRIKALWQAVRAALQQEGR